VRIGKNFSSSFPIEIGLKHGMPITTTIQIRCRISYHIRNVKETNLGLDMNGTHQVLVYADVNWIDDDIRTTEGNVCKYTCLAVNAGKTKYMEVGQHRGIMANEYITVGSNSYEKGKTFKYIDSLLTNQTSTFDEIKCRLKAGNSCYYSVKTFCLFDSSLRIWKLKYTKQKYFANCATVYGLLN
jgi:hypothetical protein